MKSGYRNLCLSSVTGALMLTLAACDSGTSSPTPTPTPTSSTPTPTANAAPVFASPATISVPENITAAVYAAAASDADHDPLTYSISGGADAALLQITSAGLVSFRAPPDFELPKDADKDNVYSVEIAVTDGKATTKLTVAITVTDVTSGNSAIRKIASGLTLSNNLMAVPGSTGRVFVSQRGGRVVLLDTATGAMPATPFLDVSAETRTDGARGLLGFAPAPDFATSGNVYVALTNLAGDLEIRRYHTLAGNPERADPASADLILKVPGATTTHAADYAAGWIGFGPDGYLYVTTGADESGPNADINSLMGKVLRIDVSRDGYPADNERDYAIPAGNPGGSGRDEIWARGFSSPQSASIDRATGYMFVTDFGVIALDAHSRGDEVNMIRPQDAGLDYSVYDVRSPSCIDQANTPGFVYPILCYEWGLNPPPTDFYYAALGPTYRGPIESLQGRLIVGQRARSQIISTPIANIIQNEEQYTVKRPENFSPVGAVNAMGEDAAGNLYFLTPAGDIYVLEPA